MTGHTYAGRVLATAQMCNAGALSKVWHLSNRRVHVRYMTTPCPGTQRHIATYHTIHKFPPGISEQVS